MEAYCMKCKSTEGDQGCDGILQCKEFTGDGGRLPRVRNEALQDGQDPGA